MGLLLGCLERTMRMTLDYFILQATHPSVLPGHRSSPECPLPLSSRLPKAPARQFVLTAAVFHQYLAVNHHDLDVSPRAAPNHQAYWIHATISHPGGIPGRRPAVSDI